MPTFFGPTNIPVLEAWASDCPVITSDIRGIREQVGDAGLLVNPESPEQVAEAMHRVANDPALRDSLRKKGRARLAQYQFPDFVQKLAAILGDVQDRLASRPDR
jgi:glycosyltransferase involved in cell wall biosynthesis